jgi:hypothetical protein
MLTDGSITEQTLANLAFPQTTVIRRMFGRAQLTRSTPLNGSQNYLLKYLSE